MNKISKILGRLFLILAIAGFSLPANATTLSNWNVTELNASGDYATVSQSYDGTNTTLTVGWNAGASNLLSAIGLDKFGYNSSATVLTCASGWTCNNGSQTMDGFGSFSNFEKDPGGTDTTNIQFVLGGNATFFQNNHGSTFALHVRYGNNCSGFVSNGNSTSVGSDTSCGGSSSVPEPSSLLLLGSGLIGLAIYGRKKIVAS